MSFRIQPKIITLSNPAKLEKEEKKINEEEKTFSKSDAKPKSTTQVNFDILEGKEKNESKNWLEVAKEWKAFTEANWSGGDLPNAEAYIAYFEQYIDFMDRILACDDLPNENKAEYERMRTYAQRDLNNNKADLNRTNAKNGNKTENFRDVINEMRANVPDRTTTIEEKELALSYINRMLSCDDIPNPEYWENKKNIIEMEIEGIKNSQKSNSGENWKDAADELNAFRNKYWYQNVILGEAKLDNLSFEDAQEYYITVKRTIISFIDRVLDCNDLPSEARDGYTKLRENYINDLNNYIQEANDKKQKETNPFD